MKTTFIALSTAVLIGTAPAVLAQRASDKTPDQHRQVSSKHLGTISAHGSQHATHARRLTPGYPGAFGYAPNAPKDYSLENSRQAGGGGGGGGSGM
jgi:hypothetical protein